MQKPEAHVSELDQARERAEVPAGPGYFEVPAIRPLAEAPGDPDR